MAIIAAPAALPLRSVSWRLSTPAQINRSGWTSASKVVGLPGAALWTAKGQFVPVLGEAAARRWRGFFAALRGSVNSFRLHAGERAQVAGVSAQVDSGANAGRTLPLAGLPASATVLAAGDMVTVPLPSGHHRLVVLTAPLVSNGAGKGVASFEPELGEVPAQGTAVEVSRPYALMRLTSEPPGWDVDAGQTYGFAFAAEEAR